MNDTLEILYHDEVQLLDYGESRSAGKYIKLRLSDDNGDPLEAFRGLDTATKTKSGHIFNLTIAQGDIAELAEQEPPKKGEYGQYAAALHRSGFFNVPAVLQALGTDEEFLAWVRRQPCAHTGATQDVEAAHVRRVADGSGTGTKPPYFAIPLRREVHALQHQHGESAVKPPEWFEKQAVKHRGQWAHERMRSVFEVDSLSMVPPGDIKSWAMRKGVVRYLPSEFREVA